MLKNFKEEDKIGKLHFQILEILQILMRSFNKNQKKN